MAESDTSRNRNCMPAPATTSSRRRSRPKRQFEEETTFVDEAAMADAAEAIREVEVDAVDPEINDLSRRKAASHEHRRTCAIVAKLLDIPDREQITDQADW